MLTIILAIRWRDPVMCRYGAIPRFFLTQSGSPCKLAEVELSWLQSPINRIWKPRKWYGNMVYQCWSSCCLRQTGRKNAIHSSSNHSNTWLFIWGYLMAFWHRRKIQIIIKSWDFESHIIKSEGIIKKKLVFKHSKKWTSRTLWTFPWEKNPGKLPKRPRNAEHSGLRGGGSGTRGEDLRRLAGGGEEGGDGQPWPAIGGGFTQKPWVFQGN